MTKGQRPADGPASDISTVVSQLIAICEPQYVDWSGYRDQAELLSTTCAIMPAGSGTGTPAGEVSSMSSSCLPGRLQDVAPDSGWHDRYMALSHRFDQLYQTWNR